MEFYSIIGLSSVIFKWFQNIYNFRNAWASLGNLKRHEAMQAFIEEVVKLMPHLRAYLESLQKEEEEEQIRL